MSILRRDDTVTNALGNAISGAMVYYLTQPADVSALTPLADVYSDTTGTTGHAVAYLNGGQLYTIVYAYPNGQQVIYADQFVGSSSGAPTPFGEVPTGTINGTNCIFSISKSLSQATVWLNFPLIPGLGYTLVGTVLTYANAPQIGDSLYVQGF
jgi:hypothetical protein